MRRALAGAITLVIAVAAVVWLTSGVPPITILKFVGYQIAFVLAPGWLVFRALDPRTDDRLRQLVFGWALGYVLEVGVWILVSIVDARSAMWAYPLAVAAVVGPVWRVRARPRSRSAPSRAPAWYWAAAGLCVVAITYLGLQGFAERPLPSRANGWLVDDVWNLSIAAEAKYHWPVTDPTVSGTGLPYHIFSHINDAATSSVTGISLPVVYFRLSAVPQLILVVVGLCFAGGALTRRRWAGPAAAALVLLTGEANLDPFTQYAWANRLPDDIISLSPTLLLGVALYIPALVLLHEAYDQPREFTPARYGLLTLLVVGCAGAKATSLPLLIGALALCVAWRWRHDHEPPGVLLRLMALTVLVWLTFYLTVYASAGGADLRLRFLGTLNNMVYLQTGVLDFHLNSAVRHALLLALTPLALLAAFGASLAGLPWGSWRRHPRVRGHAILIAIGATSLLPYLIFWSPYISQLYFIEFGLVAVAIISAEGLVAVAARATISTMRGLSQFGLLWFGVLALGVLVYWKLIATSSSAGAYAARIGVLILIAGVLIGVTAFVRRRSGYWQAYGVAGILALGAVTLPLHVAASLLRPSYWSGSRSDLTPSLKAGIDWIRGHTRPDGVLAISNLPSSYYYYSALAERRVFLEGWQYSARALGADRPGVNPYLERARLIKAVFDRGSVTAVTTMVRRYGVTCFVVDKFHRGHTTSTLSTITRLVFTNRDVDIYVPDSWVRSAHFDHSNLRGRRRGTTDRLAPGRSRTGSRLAPIAISGYRSSQNRVERSSASG